MASLSRARLIEDKAGERVPSPGRRSNPPELLTSVIGREREIADVAALVEFNARLITLTGPGGIGKTRLAMSVAGQLRDAFPDGVWFISLAPISDYRLVIPTISRSLELDERANWPALDRLTQELQERRALLVLDNFEHVLAAGPDISRLLAVCPSLHVLATSREPLRLQGEHRYPVLPLAIPDENDQDAGVELPAIKLFVERARAVMPEFGLTGETAYTVAEICRRLDGMPLALELAAARVNVLSPVDLLARLDQPLAVLTGGPRDVPDRQRTMRDTLRWSYDLLSSEEQRLFRRLAVFAGGFSLEAAAAMTDDEDVLEALSSLVDKSLVGRVDRPDQPARYSMLEPVRQFALACLEESADEAYEARGRHVSFFASLVEGLRQKLDDPDAPAWFERIETEHDNLRAALRWLRESGQVELGLRLIGELGIFWHQHGFVSEGREQAQAFLQSPGASARTLARGYALWCASWLWLNRGEEELAQSMIDEALAIAEEQGDQLLQANTLLARGVNLGRRDEAGAASALEHALTLFRELRDDAQVVRVLVHFADIAWRRGDLDGSQAILKEALALARAGGLKTVLALTLGYLGVIAERSGDDECAAGLYRERLMLYHQLAIPRGMAESVEGLAGIVQRQQRLELAVSLYGMASMFRVRSGAPTDGLYAAADVEEALAALRSTVPHSVFRDAWERGRSMSTDSAVEFAVQASALKPGSGSIRIDGLTPRESEVLLLIAKQFSIRQIAAQLFISTRTVERHIENVYQKLDIHSRDEAIEFGRRHLPA